MFEKNGLLSETLSGKTSYGRTSFLTLLMIGLIALLVQGPILATDPIDADPDPDNTLTAPTMMIVVGGMEKVDVDSLPPGRYVIVVISGDGPSQSYEIHVP